MCEKGEGIFMGFKKLKKLFKGGKKANKSEDKQPLSSYDRYGKDVQALKFQSNPLYEEKSNEDAEAVEAYNPLYQGTEKQVEKTTEPAETEEISPKENTLQNIAGMPSRDSIIEMAGGLKVEKLDKHKEFLEALNALESYQMIMQEQRMVVIDETLLRRSGKTSKSGAKLDIGDADVHKAFEQMKSFVIATEQAIDNADSFFVRRSSNVQKLTPIFANLLVQAYSILPKLANLQYQISPYVMATDRGSFTYEEVLNHEVSAGRSGGYAMRGAEESNGAVVLNPDKALEALKGENAEENIANLRKDKTEEKRMSLRIPPLPVGFFKSQDSKQDAETQKSQADALTDSYIAELRTLMRALDDTAESYEKAAGQKAIEWASSYVDSTDDRWFVHEKQAEHFRMSKLFSHVIANRELLKDVIVNGMPKEFTGGYEEILALRYMEGMTLSEGVAQINKTAQYSGNFARLTDSEGKDLKEGTDYIVGGGATSISILDFKNGRVLRAPKENSQYLEKEKQNLLLNGIYDEAVGKISQFLGLNVAAQAEAVGFKGKEKGKTEERAVFGGSVMELVKGDVAGKINFKMNDGKLGISSSDGKNIGDKKIGRLLGDMMKMNVLDYIVMHGDRNENNYMINLDAKEDESMLVAIDNDMIFGRNTSERRIGDRKSSEALLAINDRARLTYGVKLKAALPMMTEELKNIIAKIDLQAFNEMLMPYVDRVSRMSAVHRVEELKKYAEGVPTCDLSTTEGVQEFVKVTVRSSMTEWARSMVASDKGIDTYGYAIARLYLPNTLVRQILISHGIGEEKGANTVYDSSNVVEIMKTLGLSKEEATEILANNLSLSNREDKIIGEEGFKNSNLSKLLDEKYDAS